MATKEENATIKSAEIGYDGRFGTIPTIEIILEGEGWSQGNSPRNLRSNDALVQHMTCLLDTFEVQFVSNLAGKPCRVRRNGNDRIVAIGHYVTDRWYEC